MVSTYICCLHMEQSWVLDKVGLPICLRYPGYTPTIPCKKAAPHYGVPLCM